MTRAKMLHQNKGHARAENTDFVARMRFKKDGEVALKSDCINLAIQYVAVYQAMENRLRVLLNEDTPNLAVFNQEPWANRSEHLQKDVIEMKTFVSDEEQPCLIADNKLFQATQRMLASINEAEPVTLFSWLSVRCLGDAFGGQGLKVHNQNIFGESQLTAYFANGVSSQANPLCKLVNHAEMNPEEEELFYRTADSVFQWHVELFEEMEAERILPEKQMELPLEQPVETQQTAVLPEKNAKPSNYSNGCRLLMFATVIVGAGLAIGSTYTSAMSPQQ